MAIKCYFMTPKIYKIPNLKSHKNKKGDTERRYAKIYNFS